MSALVLVIPLARNRRMDPMKRFGKEIKVLLLVKMESIQRFYSNRRMERPSMKQRFAETIGFQLILPVKQNQRISKTRTGSPPARNKPPAEALKRTGFVNRLKGRKSNEKELLKVEPSHQIVLFFCFKSGRNKATVRAKF